MKTPKTVIVTGASQGIGACLVKTFLERGYHVVATARSMEKSDFRASKLLALVDADSRSALWLLVRTYSALLARIEAGDFAVFAERVRLPKKDKLYFAGLARFGRLTEENVLEKRDRDRRRVGGFGGRRRAG